MIKLGAGEDCRAAVTYPDVWQLEKTKGPERLRIGPASRHVEILLAIAESWPTEYYLLYVLLTPRLGKREPGRYQSPAPLSFERVAEFCRRFAPFLEGDGRHHLWIGSVGDAGLLVYDHHQWIWAYGDLAAYMQLLDSRGFMEGEVRAPVPHSHNYHSEFDAEEDEIFAFWDWKYFPLQPDDDD